jgi:hypothetical protein
MVHQKIRTLYLILTRIEAQVRKRTRQFINFEYGSILATHQMAK